MATSTDLLAMGLAAPLSHMLGFDDPQETLTASGTTQLTAAKMASSSVAVTGTGGIILANRGPSVIEMLSAAGAVTLYPPVGRRFLGLAVNAGFALVAGDVLVTIDVGYGIVLVRGLPAAALT